VIAIGTGDDEAGQEIVAETGHQAARGVRREVSGGHDRRQIFAIHWGSKGVPGRTDGDGQSRCPCLGRDAKPGPTFADRALNQLSHPSRFFEGLRCRERPLATIRP